jgi:hypothetical protein
MKQLAVSILCATALISIPTAMAQLNIQGEDGSTVQIGPGGINVHSNTGKHSNVQITPGGIKVNSTPPSKVKSTTVTTTRVGSGGTSVRTTTTTATGFNLKSALAKLEMSAYGKANESAPIIQRIQKLEMDNLGHTGTGSNIARVQSLAVAMGVNLSGGGSGGGGARTSVTTNTSTTETIVNTGNAQPTPPIWAITDDHHSGTFFCNNSIVSISSNHCNLVLTGHCKQLSITGNHNNVQVERASGIDTPGNHNTVMWVKAPMPAVSNYGNYNNIGQFQ